MESITSSLLPPKATVTIQRGNRYTSTKWTSKCRQPRALSAVHWDCVFLQAKRGWAEQGQLGGQGRKGRPCVLLPVQTDHSRWRWHPCVSCHTCGCGRWHPAHCPPLQCIAPGPRTQFGGTSLQRGWRSDKRRTWGLHESSPGIEEVGGNDLNTAETGSAYSSFWIQQQGESRDDKPGAPGA